MGEQGIESKWKKQMKRNAQLTLFYMCVRVLVAASSSFLFPSHSQKLTFDLICESVRCRRMRVQWVRCMCPCRNQRDAEVNKLLFNEIRSFHSNGLHIICMGWRERDWWWW